MTAPRPLPSGEPLGWSIIALVAFVAVSYALGICALALHFFS